MRTFGYLLLTLFFFVLCALPIWFFWDLAFVAGMTPYSIDLWGALLLEFLTGSILTAAMPIAMAANKLLGNMMPD